MTFGEKLKKLRNENRLTQDELAERLYVTRTAISKWETDKGYPNIESLKAIASFFSITVDDLLSSDEILTIAEEDQKQARKRFIDLIFGLLDICNSLLLFLPLFAASKVLFPFSLLLPLLVSAVFLNQPFPNLYPRHYLPITYCAFKYPVPNYVNFIIISHLNMRIIPKIRNHFNLFKSLFRRKNKSFFLYFIGNHILCPFPFFYQNKSNYTFK